MKINLLLLLSWCFFTASAFELTEDEYLKMIQPPTLKQHCLIFQDGFNHLDHKKWEHEVTSEKDTGEFQTFTNNRSNSFIEAGILYIKPTWSSDAESIQPLRRHSHMSLPHQQKLDICSDTSDQTCSQSTANTLPKHRIQSARLRTRQSMNLRYGKVEVRARLPVGDWLWPSIWMLPKDSVYGSWPASGEIDILQSRGNVKYEHGNTTMISSTLHWGPHEMLNRYAQTHAEAILDDNTTFADHFHTYGLEWSMEGLRTSVDNRTVLQVDFDQPFWNRGEFPSWSMNPWTDGEIAAPFDQEFYLILDVAVGGTTGYWPDSPSKPWRNNDLDAAEKFWSKRDEWIDTWDNTKKGAFAIDWVKVWSADMDC
ncbi:concanavalin A-like lectin/glucanase domain-containing protein [Radiomyces spectabilis]|uniref:concanavalin A-like lectin/glucanase domain-containing protein n=1 Tax=Radiomyces spectabilis TaxID=64574 RepID=UPI002220C058|nr:concanavalin A-like lectin/glucanase domain-containing protein [Radiomyces spectabilis]KAI8376228.1 concanavalin A-like lectin/glucanase domain-containing protein [Radiomyces spectabilis]